MNDTQHDRFATVLSPTEIRFKHSDLSLNKAPPPERYKEMDRTGRQAMLQITEIDRPRHLAFTWGDGSEVVFDLAPQGDKVLLTLTHRRIAKRADMVGAAGGWHCHLAILVDKAWAACRRPSGMCSGSMTENTTGAFPGDGRTGYWAWATFSPLLSSPRIRR